MARFLITYFPTLGMPDETVKADSHEVEGDFLTFYDKEGYATHRFKAQSILSVKPAE